MKSVASYLLFAAPFFVGQALASLNCTVADGAMVTEYACDVWFKLYNGMFSSGEDLVGCNYEGYPFEQTGLPFCYEESMMPSPTTCVGRAETPAETNPPITTLNAPPPGVGPVIPEAPPGKE
ncbi:hypothetical protein BDY21DRAFT_372999 [Lineolata rhizophorae]|uniref:LysM domain-containing protein n=1 Tax=Lineolata rhizophorae TaxID=578093 RepID=A0A6A6NVX8_9PEZI|nr:hypothetical protein BDY21DRAFT_372999 [Lineolata rhizophorae]